MQYPVGSLIKIISHNDDCPPIGTYGIIAEADMIQDNLYIVVFNEDFLPCEMTDDEFEICSWFETLLSPINWSNLIKNIERWDD